MNFVISLASAKDRRLHIANEFETKNITYHFFDAVQPDQIPLMEEKYGISLSNSKLTAGEKACFFSHVEIWKMAVENKLQYVAIFEDDIFLGENANKLLNNSNWIESDWHVIKLEHFYNKVVLGTEVVCVADNLRKIFELKGPNLGAAGYVLSFEGAKKCLKYIQETVVIPVDHLIFDKCIADKKIQVHQVNPALCIQELTLKPVNNKANLSSSLFEEREKRMRKYKKRGWSKIKIECLRIIKQIRFFLTQNTVTFK